MNFEAGINHLVPCGFNFRGELWIQLPDGFDQGGLPVGIKIGFTIQFLFAMGLPDSLQGIKCFWAFWSGHQSAGRSLESDALVIKHFLIDKGKLVAVVPSHGKTPLAFPVIDVGYNFFITE